MKKITIFIASSKELEPERKEISDIVALLNRNLEKRDVFIYIEKWEFVDPGTNGQRKQDEYNEKLKDSDLCIVLFWKKLGIYTKEEFKLAFNQMQEQKKPRRIYLFFKTADREPGMTEELKEFEESIIPLYKHFSSYFSNMETLKLQIYQGMEVFLEQENSPIDLSDNYYKVTSQGNVYLGGTLLASLDNIPFVANNKEYQKMKDELQQLIQTITKDKEKLEKKTQMLNRKKILLDKDPDDEEVRMDFQVICGDVEELKVSLEKNTSRRNKMERDLEREQKNLMNSSLRIMEMKGSRITDRMIRAMEAFEAGDVKRANIILDEAEKDADNVIKDIKLAKENGKNSLEELLLKTSTKMADVSLPVHVRIEQNCSTFDKAVQLARELGDEDKSLRKILKRYRHFLIEFGLFDKAAEIGEELVELYVKRYGENHEKTANQLNSLVFIYNQIDDKKTLEALERMKTIFHNSKFKTKAPYYYHRRMGELYLRWGYYEKAKENLFKALDISNRFFKGDDITGVLSSLGHALSNLGQYDDALTFYEIVKETYEKTGAGPADMMAKHIEIGKCYIQKGELDKAFESLKQSKEIIDKHYGDDSYQASYYYRNLGVYHEKKGDDNLAIEAYQKSLRNLLSSGTENGETATVYEAIGSIYKKLNDLPKALEQYQNALSIRYKLAQGMKAKDDFRIAKLRNSIGEILLEQNECQKALDCFTTCLNIYQSANEDGDSLKVARSHYNIGNALLQLESNEEALTHFMEAKRILEKINRKDIKYVDVCNKAAVAHYVLSEYEEALSLLQLAKKTALECNAPQDVIDMLDMGTNKVTVAINK